MACNKCGHTKSSPCACQDHGLTTPCSYTDCVRNSVICEEVTCIECVVDCNEIKDVTSPVVWDAENINAPFLQNSAPGIQVHVGDNLLKTLQLMSMMIMDPDNKTAITNLGVAPVTLTITSNTTATIGWAYQNVNGVNNITSIQVYMAGEASNAYTLLTTINSSIDTTTSYNITGLNPNVAYKFKLVTSDGTNSAQSVAVYGYTEV